MRAKVLAHRGELVAAERLAREALDVLEQTDTPRWQADAWLDLAEVLELGGKTDDAVKATAQAVELYERKGIVLLAERARALVGSRQAGTTLA